MDENRQDQEPMEGLEDELTEDLREEDSEEAKSLEARRLAEVREFIALFPEAARGQIPQAVWDGVNQGFSLTGAYVRYLRSNYRPDSNYQRPAQTPIPRVPLYIDGPAWPASSASFRHVAPASTGSMRSAGGYDSSRDPFLEGWES